MSIYDVYNLLYYARQFFYRDYKLITFFIILKEPSEVFEDIGYVLTTLAVTFTKEALESAVQLLQDFNSKNVNEVDKEIYDVLRIISQLLTVRMTKELMQLIPPEVFLAMKEKIPKYYVKAYLKHHTHFSLQDLVTNLMKNMDQRYKFSLVCNRI